jgi:hypothetical protein
LIIANRHFPHEYLSLFPEAPLKKVLLVNNKMREIYVSFPHWWRLLPDREALGTELALRNFSAMPDQLSRKVLPFFNKPSQNTRNLCFYLILFRDSKPGQFFALQPLFGRLFSAIEIERVFNAVGPESLSLCPDPPLDIFMARTFESRAMISLFSYPVVDVDLSFNRMLKDKFDTQWPLQGSFVLTLANGTLQSGRHFLGQSWSAGRHSRNIKVLNGLSTE